MVKRRFRSFSSFKCTSVLVLGDVMCDQYTYGHVKRISPEAPVPIFGVDNMRVLPGGAGNVALNLQALGAKVYIVGRIGNDQEGHHLWNILQKEGINTEGLFFQDEYRTCIKNRLIANSQQLIRIDEEEITPIKTKLQEDVIAFVTAHLDEIDVIAFSDYGKGFLSSYLLDTIITLSRQKKIPTLIDPKGDDFSKYQYPTLIKPNLKEAYNASKLSAATPLDQVAKQLFKISHCEFLLITRSEEGLVLFTRLGGRLDVPAQAREVRDVTGAGDTVLAMLVMIFGAQIDLEETLDLLNIAAGIAIEHVGCQRVSLADIAERLLQIDALDKVFDEDHLFVLAQALQRKKLTVLSFDPIKERIDSLFPLIRNLAEERLSADERLLIYLNQACADDDVVAVLASLHSVDFIVLQSNCLAHLCDKVCPHRVYLVSEGKLIEMTSHHELLCN